ncbi:MAG: AsmA family protein, partial [Pseudomonadota bacterium]
QNMKRIVYLLIGVVLLLSALVVSIPFLLSSDIVRAGLLSNLKELTGRNVTFRGNPTISFQPFLGIEISELVVSGLPDANDQTPLLKVETVNAQLDILPALLGNVEITQYQLVRPELDLRIYQHGKANWEFEKGSLREVFTPTGESDTNSGRTE